MIKYVFLRFLLWNVGVFVSLFPTLYSLGSEAFTSDPVILADRINHHGQFRDVLFVLVTIAVLEISLLCDFLYVRFREADENLFFLALVMLITNCIVLGASLIGFAHLPAEGRLADEWLVPVSRIVIGCAAAGLFTEIVIACCNHHLDTKSIP